MFKVVYKGSRSPQNIPEVSRWSKRFKRNKEGIQRFHNAQDGPRGSKMVQKDSISSRKYKKSGHYLKVKKSSIRLWKSQEGSRRLKEVQKDLFSSSSLILITGSPITFPSSRSIIRTPFCLLLKLASSS